MRCIPSYSAMLLPVLPLSVSRPLTSRDRVQDPYGIQFFEGRACVATVADKRAQDFEKVGDGLVIAVEGVLGAIRPLVASLDAGAEKLTPDGRQVILRYLRRVSEVPNSFGPDD